MRKHSGILGRRLSGSGLEISAERWNRWADATPTGSCACIERPNRRRGELDRNDAVQIFEDMTVRLVSKRGSPSSWPSPLRRRNSFIEFAGRLLNGDSIQRSDGSCLFQHDRSEMVLARFDLNCSGV